MVDFNKYLKKNMSSNNSSNPPFEFLTGAAGTGKTYTLKQRIANAKAKGTKNYAVLTATTGIAAINLSGGTGDNVATVNSTLGYFDTQSLKDAFAARKLHRRLKELSQQARVIAIDEISMMGGEALDIIYDAVMEVNDLAEVQNRGGLGLILSGDFLQLPPVKEDFAFTAKCFKNFKVTKLDKIWRQDNRQFIDMLNAARAGDGKKVSNCLFDIPGISVRGIIDSNFDGTTIVPVNKLVDSLNKIRLDELLKDSKNVLLEFPSLRWGTQRGEWKLIPEKRTVCKNAYVMILANDAPNFSYANGSCGYVMDADILTGTVWIKLKENGVTIKVRKVTRKNYVRETPFGCVEPNKWMSKSEWIRDWKEGMIAPGTLNFLSTTVVSTSPIAPTASAAVMVDIGTATGNLTEEISEGQDATYGAMYKAYLIQLTASLRVAGKPYFDFLEEKWVIGECTYTPIRLAYASTVHKTQGLSLDAVQIEFSHAFFGEPSMCYVALSRCRTPGGLTVVGNKHLFEERTNISSEVLEWV